MTMLASAPPTKDEALKIMHERHEGMETIGKSNKAIKRELDAASPDLSVVRASSAKIARFRAKLPAGSPRAPGLSLARLARAGNLAKCTGFRRQARQFPEGRAIFDAAARGSDANATKARFADMARTCKACHEKYRSEMHH